MPVSEEKSAIGEIFSFLITLNILLSTAISFFMDKSTFLPGYQDLVAGWFIIPIICLIIAFVCFQMTRNSISEKEILSYRRWLLVSILLNAVVLFGSKYPTFISPYFVLVLVFAIAFNITISFGLILLPLSLKVIRVYFHLAKPKYRGIFF